VSDDPWDKKPDDELGSLAQSARKSSLKQARTILIILGVLNVLGGLFLYMNAQNEAREVIEQEKRKAGPLVTFDPVEVKKAEDEVTRIARLIYLGVIAVSVVFIILGIAVPKAPVACTVTGLVLYLALNAMAAMADPVNLVRGIILKIVFLVALIKAVQAATAYQREVKAERESSRRDISDYE
jgi:hypothetical protein